MAKRHAFRQGVEFGFVDSISHNSVKDCLGAKMRFVSFTNQQFLGYLFKDDPN